MALSATGIVMGIFLIEYSVAGAVIGCALAYIEMALYEKIKNTIEYYIQKNKN